MSERSNVSPATLPVARTAAGIEVEYLDGRRVVYRADPEPVQAAVSAPERSHVHVLVRDDAAQRGRLVYLNDLDTDDAVLEQSGVGRVLVGDGEEAAIDHGVDVTRTGEHLRIDVDHHPPDRSVYVFVENQLGERAYRFEPPENGIDGH